MVAPHGKGPSGTGKSGWFRGHQAGKVDLERPTCRKGRSPPSFDSRPGARSVLTAQETTILGGAGGGAVRAELQLCVGFWPLLGIDLWTGNDEDWTVQGRDSGAFCRDLELLTAASVRRKNMDTEESCGGKPEAAVYQIIMDQM